MRSRLLALSVVVVVANALLLFDARSHEPPMNVVIFLVDDMGWTDLGCQGSDLYDTPNIDRLAAIGTRFTDGYAACTVCSPTRAAMLTGQYPARLRVTDFIPGHDLRNLPMNIPDWTQRLELDEITLAEMLKTAGYQTAHLGKWHLTDRDRSAKGNSTGHYPTHYPDKQGFDVNIGGNEHGAPPSYFWPYGRGKTLAEKKDNPILRTLPPSEENRLEEYLTDRIAEEGVRLIEQFAQDSKNRPFFTSFCFYNVHTPLQAPEDQVSKYKKKIEATAPKNHTNPTYAAMVSSVDRAVGRVLETLQNQGIAKRTLIVFTSDNGGLRPQATDNAPLRQGKGGIYEGGVRVPFIVHWPGVTPAGSVSAEPVITMDILPTVLDVVGVEAPAEAAKKIDGQSLTALLRDPQNASLSRDAIYWHYPHYHSMGARPYSAIRAGKWKLIQLHNRMEQPELYDLASDIHEDHNLTQKHPDKATELLKKLDAWRKSVDAQMPTPNPDYDPGKATGRPDKSGKIKPIVAVRE
jgi:arylsulfatase A-like enzyme